MAQFVSPGVYARELDFSSYVARISGTVMAIIGSAGKGPVGVPTLCTDAAQAKKKFGAPLPTAGNKANYGLHGLINALQQTSQCYYLRVTDGSEAAAVAGASIIVNDQIVYKMDDTSGITLTGGKLGFTLQITKKSGTMLGADAYNALVRRFGAKNLFTASYAAITSLAGLTAAIGGSGAFVNIPVPMAIGDKTFETAEAFSARFNRIMHDGALRGDVVTQHDNTLGTIKFMVIKTQNLSDMLALNLEFAILDDFLTSPGASGDGYAQVVYNNAVANAHVLLKAVNPGIVGNGFSVVISDGGVAVTTPVVTVSGRTVSVSIHATVTTAQQVVDAINGNSAARLMIVASNDTSSTGVGITTVGTATLVAGGSNTPSTMANPVASSIGTSNASSSKTQILAPTSSKKLLFTAKSAGEYANGAKILFSKDAVGLATIEYREGNTTGEKAIGLTIQPSGSAGSFLDFLTSFENLGAVSDYTLLSDSTNLTTALGGIDVITDAALLTWLKWNAYEFYEGAPLVLSGGLSGVPADYADLVDSVIGNPADRTGLYAFANRERFDNFYLSAPGFDQPSVIRAGLAIAEAAGDMVYVLDAPGGVDLTKGLTVEEVVDWHNGRGQGNSAAFDSSYGTLYHAWQLTRDTFNGVDHYVPPSVLVLEQFAFSENVGEKWFAKAGFKRGRLLRSQGGQSASENNQGDRDYMYSNGNAINPIVNFLKEGPTIFGQRTLQRAASALDRLNVRDLLNFCKRSAAAAVRIDLFDPNDDILLGEITRKLSPIFAEIRAKRGINKFEVKFDKSTTTDVAKDNNEIIGYILIEPTKAAEKIILNFVVTAQGASFSEALAAAGVV